MIVTRKIGQYPNDEVLSHRSPYMSEPIKPALTAEEWALEAVNRSGTAFGICADWLHLADGGEMVVGFGPPFRHCLAALALHGQSFGFKQADVDFLRSETKVHHFPPAIRFQERSDALNSLADRIQALLPPQDGA